jgi:hypothetical protein
MRTSAKKARGRPRGRKAPHRPVLSVRVPEELYEKVQVSARASGRTFSEESVWSIQQRYEWESAFEATRAMLAETRRQCASMLAETRRAADASLKVPLEQTLRERGYTKVAAIEGVVWFEPGVSAPTWIFSNFNSDTRLLLQEMFDQAAMRALERAGVKS